MTSYGCAKWSCIQRALASFSENAGKSPLHVVAQVCAGGAVHSGGAGSAHPGHTEPQLEAAATTWQQQALLTAPYSLAETLTEALTWCVCCWFSQQEMP